MSITSKQTPFQLHRLGTIMAPNPDNPQEAWGVLNPAAARGPDGDLYLFPRIVAEGNYSRIGIARVDFNDEGDPIGATRLGYALEPETDYERSERAIGGVEDPRVTWVEPLRTYVMAYTAVSARGPRIALAISDDLFRWRRLGLLEYQPTHDVDFAIYGNKDGALFPEVVCDPSGKPALAILHRPTYLVSQGDGTISLQIPPGIRDERESIWIGYISVEDAQRDITNLVKVYENHLVAVPQDPWEILKIGGGTPPVRIPEGWLMFYHGVSGSYSLNPAIPKDVYYAAGAMVLDADHPQQVIYRSSTPVLAPDRHEEQEGIVSNVVFPTGIDLREDGRVDVYYGMADSRIGAACTTIPAQLPGRSA